MGSIDTKPANYSKKGRHLKRHCNPQVDSEDKAQGSAKIANLCGPVLHCAVDGSSFELVVGASGRAQPALPRNGLSKLILDSYLSKRRCGLQFRGAGDHAPSLEIVARATL